MFQQFLWVAIFLSSFAVSAQNVKIAAWGNNGYGETWVPADLPSVKTAIITANSGLALLSDGQLATWGNNSSGQTNFPASATNIIAIARSSTHSLALRTNGTAIGWGRDPSVSGSTATNLAGQFGISQIAAGSGFTLLLQSGQVSQRPSSVFSAYGRIAAPFGLNGIKQISAGDDIGVALRSNGTVVVWGNPVCTNPPAGLSDVKSIVAGSQHVLALRSNGTVVAWGENYWKQTNVPAGLSNVVEIAAGAFHNLALRNDGSIVTWGDGWAGETSLPDGLTNVVSIAARGVNSIALIADGPPQISKQPKSRSVFPGDSIKLGVTAVGLSPLSFQWQREGTNLVGETNSILVLTNVSAGETGGYSVTVSNPMTNIISQIAQVDLGTIASWGSNDAEQLEIPAGQTNIANIVARRSLGFALSTDGTVAAWGGNPFGDKPELSNVVAIASGPLHALFLHQDGSVSAWGENLFGETQIPENVTNILAVSAGSSFSVALKHDRTVTSWGLSGLGQTDVPVGLSNVTSIASGFNHTLALKSDGKVVAWGNNSSAPGSLSNVVAIAAGAFASLALKDDGTMIGWGGITIPTGLSNIVALSHDFAGNVLALRSDGGVVAFGNYNPSGQNNVPDGLTNVTRIASGWSHNLALVGDGSPAFPTALIERSVPVGETLQLPALATGVQPMSYQWQFNGENIPEQTNSMLSISNAPLRSAGSYRVIASNSVGVQINATTLVTMVRSPVRFATSADGLYSSNGMVNLRADGFAGTGAIVLFASTNLVDWDPIFTNTPAVGTINFSVPATTQFRFFRVVEAF